MTEPSQAVIKVSKKARDKEIGVGKEGASAF